MEKSNKTAIIIFLKYPTMGFVKTRLAKSIGYHQATNYAYLMIQMTLKIVFSICKNSHFYPWIFYDPYCELERYEHLFIDLKKTNYILYPQFGENLGDRLYESFSHTLKSCQKSIIIGTDCPYLEEKHLIEADKKLSSNDLVLGPADDGGYYLIGLNKNDKQLFLDIPWSTKDVFMKTISAAKKLNYRIDTLEKLSDIDTIEDLKKAIEDNVITFRPSDLNVDFFHIRNSFFCDQDLERSKSS